MLIINRHPGMMAEKNGHAVYPDDFPLLRRTGRNFDAVREGDNWVIETTLNGDALWERLEPYANMDTTPSAEEIKNRQTQRKALLNSMRKTFSAAKKRNIRAYAAIAVMFSAIEECGFSIYIPENEDYIEIEAWTPNGVDMIEMIDLRDADVISPWTIADGLHEAVDAFDTDEEIRLHMEGESFSSAFTYKAAVEEFDSWEKKLNEAYKCLVQAVEDLTSLGITESLFDGKKFDLPYAYKVYSSVDTN